MTVWDEWAKNPIWGKLSGDSAFTQLTPQFQKTWHDILFRYGDNVSAAQQANLAPGTSVEANPYSVFANLLRSHENANHATFNAANNANLEESGAAVGGLNANTEALKAGQAAARSQETSDLNAAMGGYIGDVNSVIARLQSEAANAPPPAPPEPAPQPDAPVYTGAPVAARPGAMPFDPGGAQPDPWGMGKKPKIPKGPTFAGMLRPGRF